MLNRTHLALAASTALLLAACSGDDANLAAVGTSDIYATNGTQLFVFSPSDRLNGTANAFTGLAAGTTVVGLDVNPNGVALVALGSNGQVYTVDKATAALTAVGAADAVTSLANKRVDIDFNPRAQNVFRVVTNSGDNYRRNATTGARPGTDKAFVYTPGDINAGKTIAVVGVAYTDSFSNSGTIPFDTTAYVVDASNNVLAVLGGNPASGTAGSAANPNEGVLTTVCDLQTDIRNPLGFDIDSKFGELGYIVAPRDGGLGLYTLNLTSCAFQFAGLLPPSLGTLTGFAIQQ